jgi:two-component system, NarL family, sensor histidine kinase UhpB
MSPQSYLVASMAHKPMSDGRLPQRRNRRSGHPRRYLPLVQRVTTLNVVLVLAAVALTVVVLAPTRLSAFAVDAEVAVVLGAVALVVVANVYLVRRLVGPVQAVTDLARRVDLANPGQRMPSAEATSEAGELALRFNEMLARLEAERRDATGRVLAAQEAERLRIAQELHDQVGQELTAVLLGLSRVQSRAPDSMRPDLLAVQDVVRASVEDVRRIAIELRPEALDDLGLASALAVLADRFSERLGLEVRLEIAPDLPQLSTEAELVIYRVAQEALTNVARHAGVDLAELALVDTGRRLTLTVRDRGRGLAADSAAGTGMRGMRERAALIDASVRIGTPPGGHGCEVRLDVPLEEPR